MTLLRDVMLQCPICATWFATRVVAAPGAVAGTRTDFHRRLGGVRSLPYLVHLCGACGFAGLDEDFLEDEIGAASAAEPPGPLAPLLQTGVTAGSERYEAAARATERRGAGRKTGGDLLLRAAWCCVDEGDVRSSTTWLNHRERRSRACVRVHLGACAVPRRKVAPRFDMT